MLLARYARGDIAARIIKRILRTFLSTEVVETRVTEDEWTPGDISAVKSLHPFSNRESFTYMLAAADRFQENAFRQLLGVKIGMVPLCEFPLILTEGPGR